MAIIYGNNAQRYRPFFSLEAKLSTIVKY